MRSTRAVIGILLSMSLSWLLGLSKIHAHALSSGCFVSNRAECVRNAHLVNLKVPPLSPQQAFEGPGEFASLFGWDDIIECEKNRTVRISGGSSKFFCEAQGHLFKVKYVFRGSERLDTRVSKFAARDREAFVEIAATRLAWAMGIASDATYSVQAVKCRGCAHDPYKDSADKPGSTYFLFPSIEIRVNGIEIKRASGDEYWSWRELEKLWSTRPIEVEYLLLFSNFISHHNLDRDKHNRFVCTSYDRSTGFCRRPVMIMDDLGGTLGGMYGGPYLKNIESMRLQNDGAFNPRGNYSYFSHPKNSVFKNGCHLRVGFRSLRAISEKTRRIFMENAKRGLNPENLLSILKASRFDIVDLNLREFLRRQNPGARDSDLSQMVLKKWQESLTNRLREIDTAACGDEAQ